MHQSASQLDSDTLTSERTGQGSSASQHQPSSQLRSHLHQPESSPKRTGTDSSASKHRSTIQLRSDRPISSSPKRTGSDSSASKQQSTSQLQSDRHQPRSTEHTGNDSCATRHQSTSKFSSHRSQTNRPKSTVYTDTGSPVLHRQRKDSASSVSSEAGSDISDQPPVDLYAEEGELSDDQDMTVTEPDQTLSAEHTYRETMRGIRSYMGWSNIPDMDSSNTASDDNPFSGPKIPVPGKVFVQMPTEDWLCKKLSKLNLTLVERSYSSEAGGLMKDQFLRPAKSQSKWYRLFSNHKVDSSPVSTWSTDAYKLNSCYSRIARQSGLTSTPPALRRISQETLRRWEKLAREAMVICNQAASFNWCLFKVQQNMQEQLKTVRTESKGKGSSKVSFATEELQFLMDFNASITQAAVKTMEHLTEFVFLSMGNLTLACRDAYLNHLKSGIKPYTVAALRTAPLHIPTLFPDSVIRRAEEEIAHFESKGQASSRSKGRYHPYKWTERNYPQREYKLKYVKGVSCVTQVSCVKPVTNVKNVASNLPVWARLHNYWKIWLNLGAGPKVVQILREGNTLPFPIQPKLTRSPTVINCYVNPNKNLVLLEVLHQLMNKNAVELVQNKKSLGFFNQLFLVPKPNNKWRPILDLSKLNLFLKAENFKMETPEMIRTSLQQGEWVTSLDFKDAYFHIPIQEQSMYRVRHTSSRHCHSVCPQHPWSSL